MSQPFISAVPVTSPAQEDNVSHRRPLTCYNVTSQGTKCKFYLLTPSEETRECIWVRITLPHFSSPVCHYNVMTGLAVSHHCATAHRPLDMSDPAFPFLIPACLSQTLTFMFLAGVTTFPFHIGWHQKGQSQ